MSVIVSDVKTMATELASVSDSTVELWLNAAVSRVNRTAFGDNADNATKYLAAHLTTLATKANSGASSGTGSIRQRKVGDVSTTFAVGTADAQDATLMSTIWGQMYMDLRRLVFADRRT